MPCGQGFYENNFMNYEGYFNQGSFDGNGKITYKNGIIIEGNFQNNVITYGQIKYPNQDSYVGYIEGTEPVGQGEFRHYSGDVY